MTFEAAFRVCIVQFDNQICAQRLECIQKSRVESTCRGSRVKTRVKSALKCLKKCEKKPRVIRVIIYFLFLR